MTIEHDEKTLPKYLENALDSVDACIFTGDTLYDDASRARLKYYFERWNRAIEAHEKDSD